MLNIIFNIIGIALVIYSVYIIKKDIDRDKNLINELDIIEGKVKEYYNLTEDIVENFDQIIDSKLEILNRDYNSISNNDLLTEEDTVANVTDSLDSKNFSSLINLENNKDDSITSFHKRIIELNDIGLTKEEIAKKLNKGIREIEMVLKIYNVKKKI